MVLRTAKESKVLQSFEIDSLDAELPKISKHHSPVLRRKKSYLFPLIILVIIILGGGTVAYLFIKEQRSDGGVSPGDTSGINGSSSTHKLTAQILIASAKLAVKGNVKQTLIGADSTPYKVYSAPGYKPSGYNFTVSPTVEFGFGAYGTKATSSDDLVTIEQVLIDNNLQETILDSGSDVGSFVARYDSDDITCSVSDQKPYGEPSTSDNYAAIVGCANKSDYVENAAALRPYFVTYAAQSQNNISNLALDNLIITESKTPGYTISQVNISGSEYGAVGGFVGLFYSTPDGTLHYFLGTQNELDCNSYNTADLKKAYLGEKCYDQAKGAQATVTL